MAQALPPAAEQARTYSIPYVIPRKKHNRGRRRRKTIWSKTLSSAALANYIVLGIMNTEK